MNEKSVYEKNDNQYVYRKNILFYGLLEVTFTKTAEDTVSMVYTCPSCKKETNIELHPCDANQLMSDIKAYANGDINNMEIEYIGSNPDLREMLISGLCKTCQDEIFGF